MTCVICKRLRAMENSQRCLPCDLVYSEVEASVRRAVERRADCNGDLSTIVFAHNRKFVRIRDGAMRAFGRSGRGKPFLRDHNDEDVNARAGSILLTIAIELAIIDLGGEA